MADPGFKDHQIVHSAARALISKWAENSFIIPNEPAMNKPTLNEPAKMFCVYWGWELLRLLNF